MRLGSNSVENAAYNDFLLDGPESLEHGAAAELGEMSMSLADSASLNLSIADLPASHATRKNKNMEISFESLCVNEKSIQGEASWDVTAFRTNLIDITVGSEGWKIHGDGREFRVTAKYPVYAVPPAVNTGEANAARAAAPQLR